MANETFSPAAFANELMPLIRIGARSAAIKEIAALPQDQAMAVVGFVCRNLTHNAVELTAFVQAMAVRY